MKDFNKESLIKTAKPILFNREMVEAILDNTKKAPRRTVKFKGNKNPNWSGYAKDGLILYNGNNEPCNIPPQFKIGDILYVRETWIVQSGYPAALGFDVGYLAGKPEIRACIFETVKRYRKFVKYEDKTTWQPALFMPKEAARIFLRITDVRLERLQELTIADIEKEGIGCPTAYDGEIIDYIADFAKLWNSTVKKESADKYDWNANPWVYAYEFERIVI